MHSVVRKDEIINASVGFLWDTCRYEMQAGPLPEIVGQRAIKVSHATNRGRKNNVMTLRDARHGICTETQQ